jgi:hypothetical protein
MKKAALPSILVAVLLAVGVTAEAQQSTKVARIGILFGASPSANAAVAKHSGKACTTWVTSRERILSLRIDMQREN